MFYTLNDLFAKLGLPNTAAEIDAFIAKHNPIPQAEPLANAPFWTAEQAAFLRKNGFRFSGEVVAAVAEQVR